VFLLNITPSSRHAQGWSPLRAALKGKQPDISHLRVFGSPVSVLNPINRKTDGQLRGFASIYLGPSGVHPEAHLVLNKGGDRVIASNEVTFGEHFQWITDGPGPLSAVNRPLGITQYDALIRQYEAAPSCEPDVNAPVHRETSQTPRESNANMHNLFTVDDSYDPAPQAPPAQIEPLSNDSDAAPWADDAPFSPVADAAPTPQQNAPAVPVFIAPPVQRRAAPITTAPTCQFQQLPPAPRCDLALYCELRAAVKSKDAARCLVVQSEIDRHRRLASADPASHTSVIKLYLDTKSAIRSADSTAIAAAATAVQQYRQRHTRTYRNVPSRHPKRVKSVLPGTYASRLRDDFDKDNTVDADIQWANLLKPDISLAMHMMGTKVDGDVLAPKEPDARAMYELTCAYAVQLREAIALGTTPSDVHIDANHPKVLRVLNELPQEYRSQGVDSMLKEVKTLVDLEFALWEDLPPGKKTIPCKMVPKVKFYADGSFDKVKMRCVVRGFLQRNGLDFGATYSPTAMLSTLRILLTIAAANGWNIVELDIRNAYCHGEFDREMYIRMPDGVHLPDPEYEKDIENGRPPRPRALRLKKGLYGTHQGGRLWFERYCKELVEVQGFTQCHYDPSLFQRWRNGKVTYVAIYVDDSIITGSDDDGIEELRSHLINLFGGTSGPLNSFLGMHMTYDRTIGQIIVRHSAYRQNIYDRFQISSELTSKSPYLHDNKGISWDDSRHLPMLHNYRNIVASWIFDMNACAPYAAYPLMLLCMRMHEPNRDDALKLDAFMRYMAGNIDRPFIIKRPDRQAGADIRFTSFTDSSFGDSNDLRARSTKGEIHFLNTTPFSWGCHKINRTCASTNEAEMAAAASAVHETAWARHLLIEIHQIPADARVPFWCDSAGAIAIGLDEVGMTHRNKWMAIDNFHFRDFQRHGEIKMGYVNTNNNPADAFTKPLGPIKSAGFIDLLSGSATRQTLNTELAKCLFMPPTAE
jgi:hypothetical protein